MNCCEHGCGGQVGTHVQVSAMTSRGYMDVLMCGSQNCGRLHHHDGTGVFNPQGQPLSLRREGIIAGKPLIREALSG